MGEHCGCYKCTKDRIRDWPTDKRFAAFNRMFLCETCGNKRCPHAADHRNTCTGSNEPGQAGSLYV